MTDGFQDGDYIILGARPSVGKTALALTLAFNAAVKKESVGFMSLEMKDTALFKRVLAAQSGLSMQAIRTGLLGPKGMNDLINGCSKIANTQVFFADVPNMHINDLIAEARILKSREKITFLIIDYIGLISADHGQTPRWEAFSIISQRLKSLARELKIPLLVLSQLSRASDGKRPTLADLRETGSLEQDADLVMFIHREENSNDQKQPVKLIVAKQRNGETGDINLLFDKARMQFSTDTSGGPDKEPRQPYKD
jgi:replicative DNA helicase